MGVNDLSRVDARQGGGRELNPLSVDRKSSVLTTTLPRYISINSSHQRVSVIMLV